MRRSCAAAAVVAIAVGVLIEAPGLVAGRRRQPSAQGAPPPIPYFIAAGNPEESFRPADRQLAEWALDAWHRAAGGGLRFVPAEEPAALVRLYWAGPRGGQYGEMRPLTVDGKAGAAVFIRPDMASLGAAIATRAARDPLLRDSIVYLTCVHELGHALGLEHTSDFLDIMYSFGNGGDIVEYFGRYRRQLRSRDDIAQVSGLSVADVARIKAVHPSP